MLKRRNMLDNRDVKCNIRDTVFKFKTILLMQQKKKVCKKLKNSFFLTER